MMARDVDLHPEAVEEARAAFLWYRERSESAANAFLSEMDRALAEIAEAPRRWPSYLYGARRFVLRRFPFLIVYRELEDTVQVVAVAHGRRRPGYWRRRASE